MNLRGQEIVSEFPEFKVQAFLFSGHLQTVAALYMQGYQRELQPTNHRVALPDGDILVLKDDCPESWQVGDAVVLLVHGLGGSHQSNYMVRLASRLYDEGFRVFRLDQRGCGDGIELARNTYHAGTSDDVQTVVEHLLETCPHSPIQVAGFSLGGNVVLRMLGVWGGSIPNRVVSAFVAAPPICLHNCNSNIAKRPIYNKAFRNWLVKHAALRKKFIPESVFKQLPKIRTLNEFDEKFVAPLGGFDSAEHYYEVASAKPHLENVTVPTLIVAADDDPLIPPVIFKDIADNLAITLHMTRGGGHMGFFGRSSQDQDSRWMDWRLIEWINSHQAAWQSKMARINRASAQVAL